MNPTQAAIERAVSLPPEKIHRLKGYGLRTSADGYLFRPTSVDEIRKVLEIARKSGRQVVLRGAGRSYGDANVGSECVIVDINRMNRVLSWDPQTGLIDCEAGVTIEGLWRTGLEDGYWPPVVSGTMYPTLGGALGMNIHGKNSFKVGTIGDQVVELEVLFPTGELKVLAKDDPLFYEVISSAGLLGIITRAKIQMKRIHSGNLKVLAVSCANWDEQIEIFNQYEHNSDYMVSWIDCFGKGKQNGRGQIHVGWYLDESAKYPPSLLAYNQDLPDSIMGVFPKSSVWMILKKFNNRPGMHFINYAKHQAGKMLGNGKEIEQSLVAFSFLLDYVPNWRNAYLPGGFIQYQSFVPREHAKDVFTQEIAMQQEAKLESFLGVFKLHKPDNFLFSHAVNGYSFALDFKVTDKNWPRIEKLCHRMNDVVLQAGGRFYFAKDSTLRPSDVRAYLGADTLERYRKLKAQYDPDGILTTDLARRLELV
ncbi:MAG: FAD-binding oxidoreductase [Fimbriimonas sp.]|nr:FAD-binding oxidoreductase [Fimbriimonas sp.]